MAGRHDLEHRAGGSLDPVSTARDPRYDVLFEPVAIGPVTARNRFFQVPHCNGMGYRDPNALAAMRGVKAEGGWAVVSTEEVEIHPSSETTPYVEGRIWDDADLPAHSLVVSKIHAHGSLAAIELVHNGMSAPNFYTRVPPMGPDHLPLSGSHFEPVQARRMTRDDINELRGWHRAAVRRSVQAGYDIVYVYAGHSLSTLQFFLSPRYNHRTDEYGGSLENRVRLLREVLEDTLEEVDGRAGVACRIAVDELLGTEGIDRDDIEGVLGLVGELPDVWDFMVGTWPDDSVTSRFGPEAGQEEYVLGLRQLTTKPVVGVGRFTSPDTMVRMIRQGVLDFVGAARPSIADPFLPNKIAEGRLDEIRECIGCNICVTGDWTMAPIRCTQNPAMGEEWRRGWHPETFRKTPEPERVLVVGAGPAGLEAAMAAGKRGYEVVLVEAGRQLGGRVAREASLPGLATWRRVVDYRQGQIDRLPNVEYYFESPMTTDEILDYGFRHVAVATGSTWRRDGVGHRHTSPMVIDPSMEILTPDDVLSGSRPLGRRIVLFDDEHYYMGGVLAELLRGEGFEVTLIAQTAEISDFTRNTMEQHRIQRLLLEMGCHLLTRRTVERVEEGAVSTRCVFTGRESVVECDAVLLVTARLPNEQLAIKCEDRKQEWEQAGLHTVRAIGDALAPGTIAAAVWDGRRFAQELDGADEGALYRRNVPGLVV
ncbi:MAG: FAD-dependent oxidoreductase [Acidimicrobiia bacterium]|nr:FAD-dependent oxidoreductase [Acidimicrobiia bacterium]